MGNDPQREFLRHVLATLTYRMRVAARNAPPGFVNTRLNDSSRSAGQILAHMGDLVDWAFTIAQGKQTWHSSSAQGWDLDIRRFNGSLDRLDEFLRGAEPLSCPATKLFQGPLADALTHTGQIAMLRRAAGSPVEFENYFQAEIAPGAKLSP